MKLDERVAEALHLAHEESEDGEPWVVTRYRMGLAVMRVIEETFGEHERTFTDCKDAP